MTHVPTVTPGQFDLISQRKRVQTLERAFNAAALIRIDTDAGGQLLTFFDIDHVNVGQTILILIINGTVFSP